MVRSEDHGSFEFAKMLETLRPNPREHSGKGQDPQWKIDAANRSRPTPIDSTPENRRAPLRAAPMALDGGLAQRAASDPKRVLHSA